MLRTKCNVSILLKERPSYTPKKRGPYKKRHSEVENFQNFEEETRMSASEGHGFFSSRSGNQLSILMMGNTFLFMFFIFSI